MKSLCLENDLLAIKPATHIEVVLLLIDGVEGCRKIMAS